MKSTWRVCSSLVLKTCTFNGTVTSHCFCGATFPLCFEVTVTVAWVICGTFQWLLQCIAYSDGGGNREFAAHLINGKINILDVTYLIDQIPI